MRPSTGLLIPIFLALSGCAQWIVFGHPIGDGKSGAARPVAAVATVPRDAAAPTGGTTRPAAEPVQAAPLKLAAAQPAAALDHLPVSSVTVSFTSEAKDQAAADSRLKEDSLRAAVERELRSRNLLSDAGLANVGRTIDISVDSFSTRTTTNAVVFGEILGAGTLAGDVRVRDETGSELQTFHVKASSRVNHPVNSAGPDTLNSLYQRFADLAVDSLAGAPPKPVDLTNNGMPH